MDVFLAGPGAAVGAQPSIIRCMHELPIPIFSAAQVRRLDQVAIEELEIPGYELMCRAGQAALEALRARWPGAERILVLAGAGNNAGDGYVIARLAREAELQATVVALFDTEGLKGDAGTAWRDYSSAGGGLTAWRPELTSDYDVVVDALFGTGLARPLDSRLLEAVGAANGTATPVMAVDIPSGLQADTGAILGGAMEAELTVTFVGLKRGFFAGEGPRVCGTLAWDSLGIPAEVIAASDCVGKRLSPALIRTVLPARPRTAHKGSNGHVLLIGGNYGMPGSVRLAAEAALRVGAGLLTVATRPEHVPIVMTSRPEIMCHGIDNQGDLKPLLERADVIAIGPGLGRDAWAEALLAEAFETGRPMVVDADALNLLTHRYVHRDNWIFTPHPGEAGRLLEASTAEVQRDRFGAAQAIAGRFGGVTVLKGAATLVVRDGEVPWVCDRGNPGMAAAGMGDVLTGVIAGIAAQCQDLFDAARAGVLVHALAGDSAAERGQRGLIAGDLFPHLVTWVNSIARC